MTRWMVATVVALGLGLGGCASDPYASGMRYDGESYYAPARDGYGDYYVAPEPQPYWDDPFFDPFFSPFYDPFLYGPAGGYCSARYRFCPGGFDPWFGYGHGSGWGGGYGRGAGSGWSLQFGGGDGGWYDPWRHRAPGGWSHHRPGGIPPTPSRTDRPPSAPWLQDRDGVADGDEGTADHGRPLPRRFRRPPLQDGAPAPQRWPSTPRDSGERQRGGSEGTRGERGGGGHADGARRSSDEGAAEWPRARRSKDASGG